MDINSWRDIAYNRKFETTVKFIKGMRLNNPDFTIKDIEAMLQCEYEREGQGWDGRGEVVEIGIQANIAAIQKELLAWKKELEQNNKQP